MPQDDEVAAAWERIVGWLHRHAPASAGALRPGASDEEIERLADLLESGGALSVTEGRICWTE
jgi:cell wall assembly regulator SMI1